MHLRASPESLFLILLTAMALFVLHALAKRKLDSNLPPLFYVGVVAFTIFTGRDLDGPVLLCGLTSTLVLRFEFMNRPITNTVWLVAVASVIGTVLEFAGQAFGVNYY